jgi:ribonuclease HI
MGVDVMRPAFNFEPKYRVTMLTREDWTKGTHTPPVVKGFVWFTDGSKMKGTGAGVYVQSVGRRFSFSLGGYATVFQAEIYAIFACVYEIQFQSRPEKYMSICPDSQLALKALQAVRTSPIVQQCRKVLNDISTRHAVGLYWVPGHAGVRGNEITNELARDGSALKIVGSEPALGVSRQEIRRRIRRQLVNQNWLWWRGLRNTQRQARELILGPCLGAKGRLLSFNRTHSRAVTGLLTGHNTPRRHLHLTGLLGSPMCRRCGAEEEN